MILLVFNLVLKAIEVQLSAPKGFCEETKSHYKLRYCKQKSAQGQVTSKHSALLFVDQQQQQQAYSPQTGH